MNDKIERIDPELLPFRIEDKLGKILLANEPYPGVYYIVFQENECNPGTTEYYIVMKKTATISQTVKNYGKSLTDFPDILLYSLAEDNSGWRLVDYEGLKYLSQNHLPLPEQESLHEIAIYSMEYHPEYFGPYPAPILTPTGYTLRYKQLDNGIYWLETDRCKQMLSVCYPVWSSELSQAALSLSQQTEFDQVHGIDKTLGYLFFAEQDSCIPLFELLRLREEWDALGCINEAALMNAIWTNFPEYATAHNLGEQSGANDLLGQLLNTLGAEVELKRSNEHMISLAPKVGTDFIRW